MEYPHTGVNLRFNRGTQTETGMHTRDTENGMVIGAQDELDTRAANADREAKAFEMFVREFLAAIREGADEPVSWYEQRASIRFVIAELFEDREQVVAFIDALRLDQDIGHHLAATYADQQVGYYQRNGGL